MEAFVTGIGWVGSKGMGSGRGGEPLIWGETDLPPVRLRDLFEATDGRAGRLDEFTKLGLAAVTLALRDAGLGKKDPKRRIAQVTSTVYGCLQTDVEYYRTVLPQDGLLASPNLFAYTLPNCFMGESAIRFGLTGPTVVLYEEDDGGKGSLSTALELLVDGEAVGVVAGICDLARPAFLPPQAGSLGGALFVVLERQPDRAYGRVALRSGELSVEGEPVASILELTQRLLAGRAGT
jgi:3-oxoacyl-[acyl-carrier-protein] synthase II